MPQRVQYEYNTVILNVREKGGDKTERLTTKGPVRAGIAMVPWWRSGPVILVFLHVFFQGIL